MIERKLDNLIRLNASRYDFLDRFQKMIEAYNRGALAERVIGEGSNHASSKIPQVAQIE